MSTMYAIKDTTLTALGDAVRIKKFGYLSKEKTYNLTINSYADDNLDSNYMKLIITITEAANNSVLTLADASSGTVICKVNGGAGVTQEVVVSAAQIRFTSSWNSAVSFNVVYIPVDENGNEFKYTPLEMAEQVSNMDAFPASALRVSGDCTYRFSYNNWNWLIEDYGDKITALEVTVLTNMFASSSQLTKIPFEISSKDSSTNSAINCSRAFIYCNNLTEAPVIKHIRISNMAEMYSQCYRMRYIPDPDDLDDTFEFSTSMNGTSDYCAQTFYGCYSLRKIPNRYLANIRNKGTSSYSCAYRNTFYNCVSLDELEGLGVCEPSAWTSNLLNNLNSQSFSRLKAFTFAVQEDGTPYVVNWKNQTLDLTYIGYYPSTSQRSYILNYNSGITADKEVTDDATYAALKDDPDWFTGLQEYCRYNHDSAVETINSLPDTSAYGAGTNVIKFTDISGQNTDGGAIQNLTAEEIAVATAKGWTVTLV